LWAKGIELRLLVVGQLEIILDIRATKQEHGGCEALAHATAGSTRAAERRAAGALGKNVSGEGRGR
jgi:hypothetical protein